MEERDQNEVFHYTYSAKEQAEIKHIREKYAPPEEADKMAQLRRLDASVSRKATTLSLIVGILGALILGIGMSCTMVWQGTMFLPGIFIGIAGLVAIALAYPLYNRTLRREREKIAPEILRLTDELMK